MKKPRAGPLLICVPLWQMGDELWSLHDRTIHKELAGPKTGNRVDNFTCEGRRLLTYLLTASTRKGEFTLEQYKTPLSSALGLIEELVKAHKLDAKDIPPQIKQLYKVNQSERHLYALVLDYHRSGERRPDGTGAKLVWVGPEGKQPPGVPVEL